MKGQCILSNLRLVLLVPFFWMISSWCRGEVATNLISLGKITNEVMRSVTVTNVGSNPILRVKSVAISCGCISPMIWQGDTLKAGGEIKLGVDPRGKPRGLQTETAVIQGESGTDVVLVFRYDFQPHPEVRGKEIILSKAKNVAYVEVRASGVDLNQLKVRSLSEQVPVLVSLDRHENSPRLVFRLDLEKHVPKGRAETGEVRYVLEYGVSQTNVVRFAIVGW